MANWVLVLLLFASSENGGNAMTNINGFATKKECMAAGEEWKASKRDIGRDVAYVCLLGVEKI